MYIKIVFTFLFIICAENNLEESAMTTDDNCTNWTTQNSEQENTAWHNESSRWEDGCWPTRVSK